MCGIAGTWRRSGGAAEVEILSPMLDSMAHRGPDDAGTWHDGRVALGHRRLRILDLSEKAHQPLVTADGQGVLVYNGEVYNYVELRRQLEEEGVACRSTGDTEVVLQALHRWGPERVIPRLDGMFAFAYLDRRSGTLWLARDRIGIKPLMVADLGDELVFASEIKGLLAHPRVPRRPNERTLVWLLFQGRLEPHRTAFEGIRGLAPGTWWRIDDRGIEERVYFRPIDAVDVDRLVAAGSTPASIHVEAVRERLEESVRLHLASDVPLATMCSGGVDSSLVTAMAKDSRPDLHAYVADADWSESEGDQAARVGAHLGVPVHRVHLDRETYLRLWPELVWFGDRAPYQPSDAALLHVARRCREDGIKVLLTGEGADELFGGYRWQHRAWKIWRNQGWPWRHLRGRRQAKRERARLESGPLPTMLGRKDTHARARLAFALDAEAEVRPHRLIDRLARVEPAADRAFLAQCLDDLDRHLGSILHRHDRMGMAASIEMRVPFLENELIDLAFHLPRKAKLHRGRSKWALKEVAIRRLPRNIVHARKKGFPMPPHYYRGCAGILRGGSLAEHLGWSTETTDALLLRANGWPDLELHLTGLELWLRTFFEGESPETLSELLLAHAS